MSRMDDLDPKIRQAREAYVKQQIDLLLTTVNPPDLVAWVVVETIAENIAIDAKLREIDVRAHLEKFFSYVVNRTMHIVDQVSLAELLQAIDEQRKELEKNASVGGGVGDN